MKAFTKKKRAARDKKFARQRAKRGWDDSETWSLDHSLAKLILPRLKRFKKLNDGHPSDMTSEVWEAALDKMICAFEWYAGDAPTCERLVGPPQEVDEGLKLFAEHYGQLWW